MKKYLVIYYDGRGEIMQLVVVPEAKNSRGAKQIADKSSVADAKAWRQCALQVDRMKHLWSWHDKR